MPKWTEAAIEELIGIADGGTVKSSVITEALADALSIPGFGTELWLLLTAAPTDGNST